MYDGRIDSLWKWNQVYTCCIPVVYPGDMRISLLYDRIMGSIGLYHVVYTMYLLWRGVYHIMYNIWVNIRFVYVKSMWQWQHMQCVHGVQGINAVEGAYIRGRSCSNKMKWDEYTFEYHPHDINPVINMLKFQQYAVYTWCIVVEMSNIRAACASMSYSS